MTTRTMRAAHVPHAGGPLELIECPIPEPCPTTVRIEIQACGICHSDSMTKDGLFPGITYPRVPGHEVVGRIDALGAGVMGWQIGDRVGIGWNGGYCTWCDPCRRGDFFACGTSTLVTGITSDGGYADYMLAPALALARIPDALAAVEAAPLLCAGLTTFNALRHSGARAGDTVAILGLGGLGHLGVQYAAKMGFRAIAVARGADKASLARRLGASAYIDSRAEDPAIALQRLGGAAAIIATVTNGDAMSAVTGGLAPNGTLMVLGAADPMTVSPILLLSGKRAVKGWYSGTSIDAQDTLAFSAMSGVQSMNEVYPLERAPEAYERMMSGNARFRVVLTTGR